VKRFVGSVVEIGVGKMRYRRGTGLLSRTFRHPEPRARGDNLWVRLEVCRCVILGVCLCEAKTHLETRRSLKPDGWTRAKSARTGTLLLEMLTGIVAGRCWLVRVERCLSTKWWNGVVDFFWARAGSAPPGTLLREMLTGIVLGRYWLA